MPRAVIRLVDPRWSVICVVAFTACIYLACTVCDDLLRTTRQAFSAAPPHCFTREDAQAKRIYTTCYQNGKRVFASEYRFDAQAKRYIITNQYRDPAFPASPVEPPMQGR